MAARIALLRGINVGGNRKIKMPDLAAAFVAAGAEQVTTYIQSGNVVFHHRARSEAKLGADLERQLAETFGFDVPVLLRTAAEWAAVIEQNPYPGTEPTKLHVAFLAEPPAADAVATVGPDAFPPEQYTVVGRDVYLSLPGGMGTSKLAPALGRTLLRSPATARNWRTVETLMDLVLGAGLGRVGRSPGDRPRAFAATSGGRDLMSP